MPPHDAAGDWPLGGTELARLVRAHRWADTPFGPVEDWSPALRTIVDLMLGSGTMMCLMWGPSAALVYNEPYARSIGDDHPAALGRSAFEVWPDLRHMFEGQFARAFGGEEAHVRAQPLRLAERGAAPRDHWFDLTYTPVRERDGQVAGVLVRLTDTTEHILTDRALRRGQERQTFLLRLSDALRSLGNPVEVQTVAARLLGEHLRASRAVYAEDLGDGGMVVTPECTDDAPGAEGPCRFGDLGEDLLREMRAGRPVVRPDIANDPLLGEAEKAAHVARRIGATLNVPVVRGGRLLAILSVHYAAPYDATPGEVALAQEVAERTWSAVERARAEEALRHSEERFRALAEQAEVGVAMTDGMQRFVYVNDTYARIVGRRPEDILGRTVEELTAPEDWTHNKPLLEEALSVGEPFIIEKRYIRPNGSPIWVRNSVSARRDATGRVSGLIAISLDVTDRRLAEDALRLSEARFRAIVETATDYAIFTMDVDGRIETWPQGAQDIFGWTAEEVIGQPADMTYTPEDRAAGTPEQERSQARDSGQALNVRWHMRKDGTRVFIEGVARPLRDEKGAVTGFVKVGQDVTERRRVEERLQLATQAAALGIFDVNLLTHRMDWDAQQRELWGVGLDDVITDEIFISGVHSEDREKVRAAIARASDPEGDHLYAAEYRLRDREDGIERWMAATGRVHFEGGRPVRLVGTVQDITARKFAETALRDLNDTLEQQVAERTAERDRVWRLSRDLFVVIGADGVIRAINPAVRTVLGYEPEEVVGRTFRRFMLPQDADPAQDSIGEAARDLTGFEARFRRRDGSLRWISWHTSVEGALVFAYGRDVTADKERQAQLEAAESARREADARYRAYFQNSGEALFVVGVLPDGGFTFEEVNPTHRAAMGFDVAAEPSRRIEDVLPRGVAAGVAANYRRVMELGKPQRYRETAEIEGRVVHAETVLVPVRDETGRIVRIVGSGRDMTAQVQAEEALRQSQKMDAMGQLTGGVAHDFNNLLTPILGGLDRLFRRGVGDDRDRKLIEGALQSAERARTLVQRLLAFARRQPLQPTAVDVAEVIHGMADLVASTTGPQIKVALEVEPDLPMALADANQLEMAILNLAVNARDAMPEGGTLRIAVRSGVVGLEQSAIAAAPGHYVRLSVADSGVGMDEATLARAVEPFFSTKGVGRGTGLGLSMVHGLAAQLGGALTIQSRPGQGTRVELWLPVAAPDVRAGITPARVVEYEPAPRSSGTVLLVDDEDLVRATAAEMLAELGYAVVEASSADEAMRLLGQGLALDLVVTDHLMPGLTGTELARALRAERPELPVLVVSGYADMDGIAPDLPRLTKPFRRDELAASLQGLSSIRVGADRDKD